MDYAQKRKQQGKQTEEAILKATIDLARESSFDKVSIRDICAHVGITTGAFYHHFPSKDALLARGFTPLDARMEELMGAHADASPLERLWLLLSGYAEFMENLGPMLVGRYYEHRLTSPSAATLDPNRYTLRAMQQCLTDIAQAGQLAEGMTPEWVADFLFRHFRGIVMDWVLHQGAYQLLPKLEQDYDFFRRVLEV